MNNQVKLTSPVNDITSELRVFTARHTLYCNDLTAMLQQDIDLNNDLFEYFWKLPEELARLKLLTVPSSSNKSPINRISIFNEVEEILDSNKSISEKSSEIHNLMKEIYKRITDTITPEQQSNFETIFKQRGFHKEIEKDFLVKLDKKLFQPILISQTDYNNLLKTPELPISQTIADPEKRKIYCYNLSVIICVHRLWGHSTVSEGIPRTTNTKEKLNKFRKKHALIEQFVQTNLPKILENLSSDISLVELGKIISEKYDAIVGIKLEFPFNWAVMQQESNSQTDSYFTIDNSELLGESIIKKELQQAKYYLTDLLVKEILLNLMPNFTKNNYGELKELLKNIIISINFCIDTFPLELTSSSNSSKNREKIIELVMAYVEFVISEEQSKLRSIFYKAFFNVKNKLKKNQFIPSNLNITVDSNFDFTLYLEMTSYIQTNLKAQTQAELQLFLPSLQAFIKRQPCPISSTIEQLWSKFMSEGNLQEIQKQINDQKYGGLSICNPLRLEMYFHNALKPLPINIKEQFSEIGPVHLQLLEFQQVVLSLFKSPEHHPQSAIATSPILKPLSTYSEKLGILFQQLKSIQFELDKTLFVLKMNEVKATPQDLDLINKMTQIKSALSNIYADLEQILSNSTESADQVVDLEVSEIQENQLLNLHKALLTLRSNISNPKLLDLTSEKLAEQSELIKTIQTELAKNKTQLEPIQSHIKYISSELDALTQTISKTLNV